MANQTNMCGSSPGIQRELFGKPKSVARVFLKTVVFILILTNALVAGQVHAQNAHSQQFIVGGQIVNSESEFPFMASVYIDAGGAGSFGPSCGGSLIAERWVLTAAHCVYNRVFRNAIPESRLGVYLGATNLTTNDGYFIGVSRVILHPDYDAETNQSDIALLELAEPYLAPRAVLPAKGSPVPVLGEIGTILGWGAIREGTGVSNNLRSATVPVISNASCYPYYTDSFDSRYSFCAAGDERGGRDACQGDSGGPLLVVRQEAYVVAGLVSYGEGCATGSYPGVYTRVEAFTDWITRHASGTLEYVGQSNAELSDNTVITKLELNTAIAGEIAAGETAFFDVSGARQVNLTTNSGDTDLYVLDNPNFESITADSIRCSSMRDSALDQCILPADMTEAYAAVYGYQASSYIVSAQRIAGDANITQTMTLDGELWVPPRNTDKGWIGSTGLPVHLLLLFVALIRCCVSGQQRRQRFS